MTVSEAVGRQEDRKTGRQKDRKKGRQKDKKTGRLCLLTATPRLLAALGPVLYRGGGPGELNPGAYYTAYG